MDYQFRHALDIYNEDNPRSLINLVTERFRDALLGIPRSMHELDDDELEHRTKPSIHMKTLKLAFWVELNRVHDFELDKMDITYVVSGFCTLHYFYELIRKRPLFLAWLIRPTQGYRAMMEEALHYTTRRLRTLAESIPFEKDGKFNPKNAEIFMKVHTLIENRVAGTLVHKTKNLNMHMFGAAGPIEGDEPLPGSKGSIEERVGQLFSKKSEEIASVQKQIAPELIERPVKSIYRTKEKDVTPEQPQVFEAEGRREEF